MAIIHFARREVEARIVYWGPAFCGKTTNLRSLFHTMPPTQRGDLVTLDTEGERTLLFDYLPITWGSIAGFNGRIRVLGVPGQPLYRDTRRLLLQGADGVVMVVDSHPDRIDAAVESLYELELDLADLGRLLVDMPFVLQYNKRDLPTAMPVEALQRLLNGRGFPSFPSVAIDGTGVHETFEAVATAVSERVGMELTGGMPRSTVQEAGDGERMVSDEEEVRRHVDEIRAVRPAEEAAIRAAAQPLPIPIAPLLESGGPEPSDPRPGFHVGPAYDPALPFRSGPTAGPASGPREEVETPIEAGPSSESSQASSPDLTPDGLLSEDAGPTGWTLPPSQTSALDTAWERLEATLHASSAVRQPLPPVTDDLRDILDAPITLEKLGGQWETPGEGEEGLRSGDKPAVRASGSPAGPPTSTPSRRPARSPRSRPPQAEAERPTRPPEQARPVVAAGTDAVPREPGAMVSLPFLPRSLQGRRVVRILGSQVTVDGHATVDLLLAPWVPGPPRRVRVRLMAVPREPAHNEPEPPSIGYIAFLLLLGFLVGLVIGWRLLA